MCLYHTDFHILEGNRSIIKIIRILSELLFGFNQIFLKRNNCDSSHFGHYDEKNNLSPIQISNTPLDITPSAHRP